MNRSLNSVNIALLIFLSTSSVFFIELYTVSHHHPIRVKICGITSVNDARVAADVGADAIGLVFYKPSPRYISYSVAQHVTYAVGPLVTTVGLFVNPEESDVRDVLEQVPLQLLQFHGDESEAFCQQFQRPYIKAVRMRPELDVSAAVEAYPSAQGILLDAYKKGMPGGTGETFDWQRVPRSNNGSVPIILAGGLTPNNVQQAVKETLPYAVDVSGGVELTPGTKSTEKVNQFIHNAKTVIQS